MVLLLLTGAAVLSPAEECNFDVIPIGSYTYINLEEQGVHQVGTALAVTTPENLVVASYVLSSFTDDLVFEIPQMYHAIDFLGDFRNGRQQYILIVKSSSDQPFSGGLRTFQLGAAWGYEIVTGDRLSIIAGAGVAIGEFGVESPVIPVPLIRINGGGKYLSGSFDFLTGPNLSLWLFPESRTRLIAEARMDKYRDPGDLLFDCSLHYRFFEPDSEYGDFAGVSAGIKREDLSFDLSSGTDDFSIQYYEAYVKLDFSILTLSTGLLFGGVERHGDSFSTDIGNGVLFNLQCLYQF